MKKALITFLKIAIPLGLGVFLIWYFYDQLNEEQKDQMFTAFKKADYFWVVISLVCGLLSHISRSWRWRYLLQPLGHNVSFWNSYHSVMIGYIINYALPRAGEASRAGFLTKYEKVPFEKGFGTIVAERVIDLAMLAIIGLITLGLQVDKVDLFQERVEKFNAETGGEGGGNIIGTIVLAVIALAIITGIALFVFKPMFRERIRSMIRGFIDGGKSVFTTKHKLAFVGHTVFIWVMYIAMFGLCFQALDTTSDMPLGGIMAGFIAGTIGIVVVQGGIGVYPAFVGLILTVYLAPAYPDLIHPEALALGWIIWTSQTVMMILLGGISLFLMPRINSTDEQ